MQDYVHDHFAAHPSVYGSRKPITCADGTVLSVQASEGHYCSPKEDNAERYSMVEVLSPVPLRVGRYKDKTCHDGYLYNYAPVASVNRAIKHRGGVK